MRTRRLYFCVFLLFWGVSPWGLTQTVTAINFDFNIDDVNDFLGFDVGEVAAKKALTFRQNYPVKLLAQDLYGLIIRNGLVPALDRALEQTSQNLGSTVYHRIGRAWHQVLFQHLKIAEFPESWTDTAVRVYKEMGGKGDVLNSLSVPKKKRGHFNFKDGRLKVEFLHLAFFYLWAHLPDDIKKCGPEESSSAIACVEEYAEQLQNALKATLLSFFQYVVGRYPASRLLTDSFVLAATSPCPFGYLVEPEFILAALRRDSKYLKASVPTPKKSLRAEPCPEMKTSLLKLLVSLGVTPADFIEKRSVKEELQKIETNSMQLVESEHGAVRGAGEINKKTLLKQKRESGDSKGKEEDDSPLDTAEGLFKALEDYLTNGPLNHRDAFFSSALGEAVKTTLFSESEASNAYKNRLKALLEDRNNDSFAGVGKGMTLSEVLEELKEAKEKEDKENPAKVPLKRGNEKNPEEEALRAIEIARSFRGKRQRFDIEPSDKEKKNK